jgi:hypothetical protein
MKQGVDIQVQLLTLSLSGLMFSSSLCAFLSLLRITVIAHFNQKISEHIYTIMDWAIVKKIYFPIDLRHEDEAKTTKTCKCFLDFGYSRLA